MQQDPLLVPAERLAAVLTDGLGSATGAPLTVVCGRSEADLATVVDEIRRRHDQRFKVVDLSFSESTAGADLLTAGGLLRGCQDAVTVLANVHRLPAPAVGALEALARQVAAAGARCLLTVTLPLPPQTRSAFAAVFARLHRDGLVRPVTLRPVSRRELPELVVSMTGALPETALCDRLWSRTLGWPSAVGTVLRIGADSGAITAVDRHSYLSAWPAQVQSAGYDDLLAGVRGLGLPLWSAAKAVAVLAPLGPAVSRLTGQVLGEPESEAAALLQTLADAGVLLPVRGRQVWRFRLPLLQCALRAALGPYERRRIAQIAVTALWHGTAECADPAFLPDQLTDAGNLVHAGRARTELLDHAQRATPDGDDRPLRWLRAAADLAAQRTERAGILLAHARGCLAHGAAHRALDSTDTVLHEHLDDLPDDQFVDVCLSHLAALHAAGERETLSRVAEGVWWPWPGSVAQRTIGRAAALSLLGDWRTAWQVLAELHRDPDAHLVERHLRDLGTITRLWLGDSAAFDSEVTALPARVTVGEQVTDLLRRDAEVLVALGELRRAEPLLALTGRAPVRLTTACLATLAAGGGRADEALELVRKSVATEPGTGCGPGQSVMFHLAAILLLRKGKLVRAVEMTNTARARTPALPHLLAAAEAAHHVLFGRDSDAVSVLVRALDHAEATEVVALTDLLWMSLADIAVGQGDLTLLPCYLHRVTAVAKQMNTEQAEISRLVLHSTVHADRGTATEAAALLRTRPPLERAEGLERLVRFGVGAPELLSEAYEAAGTVDALLHRSVLRNLMRTHGIPVPGRQATVAENERLLAVLVTDGLGNKQIATLLDTSEKSVEGRLSRLFSRTGYRSRVELAAAMLTGRFTA
ncbi:LuxR C-terminal-related transcriptional regulator [Lentzea sp. NBC_00516]|uniref:helix-turn-helix transcriptional regulator n=1 Tax=Lentzea sp. NBC_00516 TaxID=2903582 RepID=UPI002E7FC437|nr:LuxR C-terminal-related transcriptional regulator [Lentzea sp. NBC_00516]WUD28554.1 LuxR C-terminal-related transcriptional regulator [Lentzea sp. NBC_00516]